MKRRLTHSAVAHTTQIGAPPAINGNAASCALPANTISDISSASGSGRPLLVIATPVTKPHAAMPSATPLISRAPRANSGCRHSGSGAVSTRLMRDIVAVATGQFGLAWRPSARPQRGARRSPDGRASLGQSAKSPVTFIVTLSPRDLVVPDQAFRGRVPRAGERRGTATACQGWRWRIEPLPEMLLLASAAPPP